MKNRGFQIRRMKRGDLDLALNWAFAEGWNPGLHDRDCFYAADPQRFFMGFLDNTPVASISAVAYDEYFAFMGLYIVKPEHRGKGYGLKIWKHALNYLRTRNIGLDGVLSQEKNYQKSGFITAYRNLRYQGHSIKFALQFPYLIKLNELAFKKILEYDKKIFLSQRSQFLKSWINQPESMAFGYLFNGELLGCGVVRKCRSGYKIGPLFADNSEIAETLFQALNNYLSENTLIYLDIPQPNKLALHLVKKYKMEFVFETVRMYNREIPNIPLNKIYGITSFELG